jgi:hypothetical protein
MVEAAEHSLSSTQDGQKVKNIILGQVKNCKLIFFYLPDRSSKIKNDSTQQCS